MPDLLCLLCRRRPSSVAEWSDLAVPDAVSTLVTKDDAPNFDMATDRQRGPETRFSTRRPRLRPSPSWPESASDDGRRARWSDPIPAA